MDWLDIIKEEEQKEYYQKLMSFIDNEYQTKTIYPKREDIFKALDLTPIDKIKVVIIGQDPYFTPGVAMGLAFSVNDGCKIPKSLANIFKEINMELGISFNDSGNLEPWAKKGILLINRILTVEKDKPLSHKKKGWEEFTDTLIRNINNENRKIVFLLFGNEAKQIKSLLNNPNHLILETSHPSPLGAYHGFFGSGVFKETIKYLGETKEFWSLQ